MVKNTEVSLDNDVNVIREILFGDHIKTIQQKINQLESALSAAQKENQQLRQALDAEIEARQQAGKTEQGKLNSAVSKLQGEIKKLDEHFNTDLDNHSSEFKNSLKSLDQKLVRTSNQLKKQTTEQFANHEALHADLVKMLALALLKYQQNEGEATDAE